MKKIVEEKEEKVGRLTVTHNLGPYGTVIMEVLSDLDCPEGQKCSPDGGSCIGSNIMLGPSGGFSSDSYSSGDWGPVGPLMIGSFERHSLDVFECIIKNLKIHGNLLSREAVQRYSREARQAMKNCKETDKESFKEMNLALLEKINKNIIDDAKNKTSLKNKFDATNRKGKSNRNNRKSSHYSS